MTEKIAVEVDTKKNFGNNINFNVQIMIWDVFSGRIQVNVMGITHSSGDKIKSGNYFVHVFSIEYFHIIRMVNKQTRHTIKYNITILK